MKVSKAAIIVETGDCSCAHIEGAPLMGLRTLCGITDDIGDDFKLNRLDGTGTGFAEVTCDACKSIVQHVHGLRIRELRKE